MKSILDVGLNFLKRYQQALLAPRYAMPLILSQLLNTIIL